MLESSVEDEIDDVVNEVSPTNVCKICTAFLHYVAIPSTA